MPELSKVQICGHEFKGRPCRFGQIIAVSKAEAKELVSSGKADWAPVIPSLETIRYLLGWYYPPRNPPPNVQIPTWTPNARPAEFFTIDFAHRAEKAFKLEELSRHLDDLGLPHNRSRVVQALRYWMGRGMIRFRNGVNEITERGEAYVEKYIYPSLDPAVRAGRMSQEHAGMMEIARRDWVCFGYAVWTHFHRLADHRSLPDLVVIPALSTDSWDNINHTFGHEFETDPSRQSPNVKKNFRRDLGLGLPCAWTPLKEVHERILRDVLESVGANCVAGIELFSKPKDAWVWGGGGVTKPKDEARMEETDRKVIEAAKKGRHFYIRRRADRKEHITAYDPTTHKLQHLGLAGDAAKAVARGEWAPEDAEQSLDSEKKSNQIVHELTRAKDKGLTPSIFGGHVWVGGRKVCGTNAPVFDELEGWIKVEEYVLKLWRHRRPK